MPYCTKEDHLSWYVMPYCTKEDHLPWYGLTYCTNEDHLPWYGLTYCTKEDFTKEKARPDKSGRAFKTFKREVVILLLRSMHLIL